MADFPLTNFRAINLKIEDPTIVSRAQNGRRIARKVGGHLWSFTLSFPPMTKEQFRPVMGFLAGLRGSYGTFTVTPPNLLTSQGTANNNLALSATAAAGATTVSITNVQGLSLKSGDIIQFVGHSKVYMVVEDTASTTVKFYPGLVAQVTSGTTITNNGVKFTVALNNDIQEIKTEVTGLYSYELDVAEVY